MSFEIQPIDGRKWVIVFSDEPGYIHGLGMAPEMIEPELRCGLWLVMAVAVWNGPAIRNVEAAVACAKDHRGAFELGVLPFEHYEEFDKWWPSAQALARDEPKIQISECASGKTVRVSAGNKHIPSWLVLRDGMILYAGYGYLSRAQLSALMRSAVRSEVPRS
jgi:hypothetical protein